MEILKVTDGSLHFGNRHRALKRYCQFLSRPKLPEEFEKPGYLTVKTLMGDKPGRGAVIPTGHLSAIQKTTGPTKTDVFDALPGWDSISGRQAEIGN